MENILLIEDNVDLLENTAEILELSNFNVIKAGNGRHGLEKIKEHKNKINLILCDVMMPELDGYGVLRAIENMPDMKGIPFIFVSAKSEKADLRKGMDLGADDYLVKPFTSEELLSVISARLKKAILMRELKNSNVKDFEAYIKNPSSVDFKEIFGENARTKKLKKKETLFIEGDNAVYLYYVLSGKIKTSKTNEFGKEFVTNIYKEGEFLGYNSLLDTGSHEDTATAMEAVELAMIPKKDFLETMFSSQAVCSSFMHHMSLKLNETESKLPKVAYNSARKKVAEALVMLASKFAEGARENISFSVSRDDLSALSGIAPESVSRNLSDFKSEKLIDINGGSLVIIDLTKLEKLKN